MKIQRILVTILAGELIGSASELLNINFKKLTGVAINLNGYSEFIVFKVFEMNGELIFPKDFELNFIATNQSVSPDMKFLTINEDNNLAKLNIELALKVAEVDDIEIPIYLRLEDEK